MPDKKSSPPVVDNLLYCRSSDSPIRVDKTLRNLSRPQVELLVNNLPTKQEDHNEKEYIRSLEPSTYIEEERLNRFNGAQSRGHEPGKVSNYFDTINEKHYDNEDNDNDNNNDNDNDNDIESVTETINSFSYIVVDDGDESTVVPSLNETNVVTNGTTDDDTDFKLSSHLQALTKIFDILANRSEVDHPLSEECASQLIENYKLKFDQTQKEKDSYLAFLKKLKDRHPEDVDSIEKVEELDTKIEHSLDEYKRLATEEINYLNNLKELEGQKSQLDEELNQLKSELDGLYKNNLSEILNLKNKLKMDLDRQNNKLEQSKAAYRMHLNHLDKLRNMNIYSTLFNITVDEDDKYGMINGFRLGYKVVWPEVNAALGQIAILLTFLIKRLQIKLINYKLVPLGSRSYIVKYTETPTERTKTVLNLYSSDEFSLGKLFNYSKLDVSMIALLDIVAQVESKLNNIDHELVLPYAISSHRDSIGNKSIRVTTNGEWTHSCKFLLIDLKWILSYASVHEPI
ncbi:autophagy protein Apg6-domain-containing protein [Scheffersomyces amazonensis]|uniref:autophagy protein Apg6-domain-containing protein n=1 Tax=Scheffersomyces amazonensis TaxID=1078765 RepID=UPI00315CDD8B